VKIALLIEENLVEVIPVQGLSVGVRLGLSDQILEDVMLLLELKETMTQEEWEEFLKKEFRL
jgi:hypothetical protein